MNAPLRTIAVVADEYQLVQVLRARIDAINVSRRELSVEADLTESHAEKLLCLPPIKYFGRKSFWNVLESLGFAVMIVEDPNATARFAQRMAKRDNGKAHLRTKALVKSGRIPWLITAEKAREMGKEGAKVANGRRSSTMAKKWGRKGALIRWERVKAAVRAAD